MGTNLNERLNAPASHSGVVSTVSGLFRLRSQQAQGKGVFGLEYGGGALLPWRRGADGSTQRLTLLLEGLVQFRPLSRFSIRAGPTGYFIFITSVGEAVVLENGESTKTFHTGSGVSLSLIAGVQAGLEFTFSKRVVGNLDVYWMDPLSVPRRRYHAAFSIGIKI